MPDQIGYFASLKNAAGKVFTYLASITLTGTDGKTVTVTQDTSLDEAVAMSSKLTTPGAWTAYTPTVTSITGTITSYTAAGYWKQVGKIVFLSVKITITNNGTGATGLSVTLPVDAIRSGSVIVGKENANTGNMCSGEIYTTTFTIYNYDNTYPGGTNYVLILSGSYESI